MMNEVVSVRFSLRETRKTPHATHTHHASPLLLMWNWVFSSLNQLPNGNGTPPSRMTLQLILPSDDTGLYESLQYKKSSRPPSRTGSYLESKSPGFINTRLVNYNRPLSHQPSLRSVRSQQHLSSNEPEHHVPPPTAEEEKSKFTR